jgi:type II secretory pathway pseudopilin PulG
MKAPTDQQSRPARGFTLLEVLMVATILMILMGMLMPLISLARRSSMRTVSLSIMSKTEAALYQFKADYHAYPYQLSYADEGQPWTNALAYNVGTDIAASDQVLVKADMVAAAADYTYDLSAGYPQTKSNQAFIDNRGNGAGNQDGNGDPEGDPAPWYPRQYVGSKQWVWVYTGYAEANCILLNRLGAERASECMLIGDVNACGVTMQPESGPAGSGLYHNGRDLSQQQLLASPVSRSKPGWAKNYLQGEIASKYLSGNAILDAYLRPLIYIGQITPGTETSFGQILGSSVDVNNTWLYGLEPIGRQTLQPFNPGTTNPITGDQWLPDVTNLMHSDLRHWAPPGYELEFELWSAGADGQMSWWRDDPSNLDNIPCEPYNKSIGTMP